MKLDQYTKLLKMISYWLKSPINHELPGQPQVINQGTGLQLRDNSSDKYIILYNKI